MSVIITSGQRQSNFELLRIIAMFMVLGLHFNFKYLGVPYISLEDPSRVEILNCGCRCILESLCLPAVNIFIIISGWFTIRSNFIGLLGYLFQCFFLLAITYIIYIFIYEYPISLEGIASCIALTKYGWFVVSYLILYVMSPIINAFLKNTQKTDIQKCIVLYFSVSLLYGWIGGNSNFDNGYSVISFIGLYIIGYYLRNYLGKRLKWGGIFIISTIINAACLMVDVIFLDTFGISRILSYLNPLIIVQSISLFMIFSSLHVPQKKSINSVAKSAFAVYLIHDCSKYQEDFFSMVVNRIINTFAGEDLFFHLLLLILVTYLVAILLDQFRIKIWKFFRLNLMSKFEDYSIY